MSNKHKLAELIQKFVDELDYPMKEFVNEVNVVVGKYYEDDITLEFYFNFGVLDNKTRDNLKDYIWYQVYSFFDTETFIVSHNGKRKKKNIQESDKKMSVIEKFMTDLNIKGICGFWIDPEYDEDGVVWVYIILDSDWLMEIPTKPEFVARRMRAGVEEEIEKFLGINVRVGSVAKKCNDT